jgi:iron complex transport system ATP-binding protein
VLEIDKVTFRYGSRVVLDGISLSMAVGEFVGVLGSNGAGKSTLLRLATGLLVPHDGRVRWGGKALPQVPRLDRARALAFLPQQSTIDFPFSVREVVMMGRAPHQSLWGRSSPKDRQVVDEVLRTLELEPLADRPVTALSGGETQRAMLGAVLAQDPQLLVLDEPTSHLDIRHAVQMLESLSGRTVLVSLHDINLAAAFATRLVVLKEGRLLFDGPPAEVMTAERLGQAFDTPIQVAAMEGVPQAWVRRDGMR